MALIAGCGVPRAAWNECPANGRRGKVRAICDECNLTNGVVCKLLKERRNFEWSALADDFRTFLSHSGVSEALEFAQI